MEAHAAHRLTAGLPEQAGARQAAAVSTLPPPGGLLSRLAQLVTDLLFLAEAHRRLRRARYVHWLVRLKRLLLLAGDPAVNYRVGTARLSLPFSHRLPEYRAVYPQYDRNLLRVARVFAAAAPNLTVVDVGANVGDTLTLLRDSLDCPYLAIEGSPLFLPYLRRNVGAFPDVRLLPAFVAPEGGARPVRVESAGGSARVLPDPGGREVTFVTLQEALTGGEGVREPILLKLDTDGHDLPILRAALPLLRERRPVVFVEFYPRVDQLGLPAAAEMFAELAEAGYTVCQAYSNVGDYLFSFGPSEVALVEDLYRMLGSQDALPYLDLCLYPGEYRGVADAVRREIHAAGPWGDAE